MIDMESKSFLNLMNSINVSFLESQILAHGLSTIFSDLLAERNLSRIALEILTDKQLSKLNPNPLFDEIWYRSHNNDVLDAIENKQIPSGFYHFIYHGWAEGRTPCYAIESLLDRSLPKEASDGSDFSSEAYILQHPDAKIFCENFPFVNPHDHYINVGSRKQKFIATSDDVVNRVHSLIKGEFDGDFYLSNYKLELNRSYSKDPFEHYINHGCKRGLSPNAWFDEKWYRYYYPEIDSAIKSGLIISGFHHFIVAGRAEGRLPKHDLTTALEAKIPGVTKPVLRQRAADIRTRLKPPVVSMDYNGTPTVWYVLPMLDPDIAFGGYSACFEMICRSYDYLKNKHTNVGIILTEQVEVKVDYFTYRMKKERYTRVFSDIKIVSILDRRAISLHPEDMFVAYSAWDAYTARNLALNTNKNYVVSLVQEYEPIFFHYGSQHALCHSAFKIADFTLFNSQELCQYFQKNKIGVFSKSNIAQDSVNYAWFDHVITDLPVQSRNDMENRKAKNCVIYARPESHASRNLYEIIELALGQACSSGVFDESWNFIGLGALTDLEAVKLSDKHYLRFIKKMSVEDYRKMITNVDLGVSLMYAPHPSVVPFELCTTGAVVITNTFADRDDQYFLNMSGNFVPVEPSIDGLVEGFKAAVSLAADFDHREKNKLEKSSLAWDDVFDGKLFDVIFKISN